ncbi:nucleotidyltransferase domain-containing protein [Candidatus Woesearchaeota archaeon]|nr:nucleotidyltransferase domain-containing protein [Candidatus Woesearchaeota archaeon]
MIYLKTVQKFGNGGHLVLPKGLVGKKVRFIAETKSFGEIRLEAIKLLEPYLESIAGIYLYGSYARNEQALESDIDIFVVTTGKIKIIERHGDYSFVSATLGDIESVLRRNAVLVLPIIREAKPILNSGLLEKFSDYKFTKQNTMQFLEDTEKVLGFVLKGVEKNFEIGSMVYSMILRIRALLMIKRGVEGKMYTKSHLSHYLAGKGISTEKVGEFLDIYSREKKGIEVRESQIVDGKDVRELYGITRNLLSEIDGVFK